MAFNFKLLKEISEVPGTSGYESEVRKLIIKRVKPYVDEIKIDGIGNVIAIKKGKSRKKLMIPAHMDEIGFMVRHIDDRGFIKVQTIGGFDPKTLTAQRVIIHGKKPIVGVFGGKPIHLMTPEERGKKLKISDFHIETGYSGKELKKLVAVGDPITRKQELIEMGDCVNGKSMDNRVSVFVLIEALKKLKTKPACDVYGVFTVQEEVGLRGAHVAGHHLNPEFCICLDTTIAYEGPSASPDENITKLGEGTAIKIMDSSAIVDYRMLDFIKKTANKTKIKWQSEIMTRGGTDTGGVQRMAMDGAICGAISIPTRNIHQSVEMCNKDDITASINLLAACCKDITNYDWKHK